MAAAVATPMRLAPGAHLQRQLFSRKAATTRCLSCAARYSSQTPPAPTPNSRQWSTPLAKNLAEAITTTGPISIAKYMRECLTSPVGGYYTTQEAEGTDQFGKAGDFITSPEISQIFGELVGIWFVAEWMSQGKTSSGVELVELGPGRGTLMADALRTISRFAPMASAVGTIRLVEASPTLRAAQHRILCGEAPLETLESGDHRSRCKFLPNASIVWHQDINQLAVDAAKTPFIVAHEFFDALPIHAFTSVAQKSAVPRSTITTSSTAPKPQLEKKPNEWREILVSPTAPPSRLQPPKTPPPEFELSVAPVSTPYSRLLPSLSPRYAALLPRTDSTIEICPEARTTMAVISRLIGGASASQKGQALPTKPKPSGAALVVDYGPADTIPVNTLRGIREHRVCSPLDSPGRVDLSADVDFGALVETALAASDAVAVHGPVEQAHWLAAMGGRERCDALMARVEGPGDEAEQARRRIGGAWSRLVDRGPDGMGRVYKVLAVVPDDDSEASAPGSGSAGSARAARRPVGFGGDL